MTLTANGFFKQADETHPIPEAILSDFGSVILKAGNLINGRKTFDLLRQSPAKNSFPGLEFVVVSKQLQKNEGFFVADSPRKALEYLQQKKFAVALVAGGAALNSAFLSEGLADEIFLNIAPVIMHEGINLALSADIETRLELIDSKRLEKNIFQFHYEVVK